MKRYAALFVLAVVALTARANADLADDVTRLRSSWARSATTVNVLEPTLAYQGSVVPIALPSSAVDPKKDECTTIAVLGALSTSFVVKFLPPMRPTVWQHGEAPELSAAGAAQLVRCGPRRASFARLAIEMRSPQGILQVVVATARKPLPALQVALPHRDPGESAASTSAGPRPDAPPLAERVARLEARYQREGVTDLERRLIASDDTGGARVLFDLEEGCHRFHVLGIAEGIASGAVMDVDAELSFPDSHEIAASDRADSPDATLTFCIGEPRRALLVFAGAVPGLPVLVVHARWLLPPTLPERWGPEARAQIGYALFAHGIRALPPSPVAEWMGVLGDTALPVELEPGACYLAALVPVHGDAQLLSAAATAGRQSAYAHSGPGEVPASFAFCAGEARRGLVHVEARGSGLVWLFALWQTARLPLWESKP